MNKDHIVRKIENGTVIDHITAGEGLHMARILNLDQESTSVVLINAISRKLGKKDIVKIENRELNESEVNKIALISPNATVNIIKNSEVVEKKKIEMPKVFDGIVPCPNMNCITNSNEPIKSKMLLETSSPIKLRCFYCERVFDISEIKI